MNSKSSARWITRWSWRNRKDPSLDWQSYWEQDSGATHTSRAQKVSLKLENTCIIKQVSTHISYDGIKNTFFSPCLRVRNNVTLILNGMDHNCLIFAFLKCRLAAGARKSFTKLKIGIFISYFLIQKTPEKSLILQLLMRSRGKNRKYLF